MKNCHPPFPERSLIFAPMEGITEPLYRQVVMELFPQWDHFCTDFLRLPGNGHYSDKKIIQHFGEKIFAKEELKDKTTFQILTSSTANIEYSIQQIASLGVTHLDLNLGCPSRKVNSHKGGSYLLSDMNELKNVLSRIRIHFPHYFSVKMRIGYRNDEHFKESLKVIESEGVDAVTLHARTRDQLYKGVADWSYIKRATELLSIPLIGNGDIWKKSDIEQMFIKTNCHSVMAARGAMKTPWLAKNIKEGQEDTLLVRSKMMCSYFHHLKEAYLEAEWSPDQILRRFKALSRYLFDDFDNNEQLKKEFFRSKELNQFEENLLELSENKTLSSLH